MAAIAVAFDAGLVVARITSEAPLWAISIATLVMFVALYFVFAPVLHRWPFAHDELPRRIDADEDNEADTTQAPDDAPRRRTAFLIRGGKGISMRGNKALGDWDVPYDVQVEEDLEFEDNEADRGDER